MKYAANGQLVALDEYLDYAPNLSALIEQDDAILRALPCRTAISIPARSSTRPEGNPDPPLLINKPGWTTWPGAPTTVDELYDVLAGVPRQRPQRQRPKDEILYRGGVSDYPPPHVLRPARLLGLRHQRRYDSGLCFSWLDIDDAGKVRFIGREDKFKNMVEFTTSCGRRAW